MKTIKFLFILLLAVPAFTNAQFLGGTGRGDHSASFSDGGNCLWFNAISQYVETPAASIPTSGDFTISVWANHDASQTGAYTEILSQGTSGNAFYIGTGISGEIRLGDSWGNPGITFPTDNLWHNYTIVKTVSNAYFYIDNVLTATHGSTISNPFSTVFRIARQYSTLSEYFKGGIDEIQIWNRALTACEIGATYNMSLTGAEQNLVHYYNFNQSSGSSLTDLVSANNGTLYNSPVWTLSGAGVGGTFDLAVTTTGSSNIGFTTATVSGNVTSGTAAESGVAYNTTGCPTISDSKAIQTVSSGAFSASLTGLNTGTNYYARAYATDANGNSYGDEVSITTLSPVVVTATAGTAGPTGYATLKAAFDAINLGTHHGVITIKLYASTTETASAVLNASGSGSAVYSAVTIYPIATGLSITGNLAKPLIDLNGADNVTLDGRVNATGFAKDLVIMNTSTSSTDSTSTIRFTNAAQSNLIRYCTVKGSSMALISAVIFFGESSATQGNDHNIIDHNNITSATDADRPRCAVLHASSLIECNDVTITSNNFYDFFNRGSNAFCVHAGEYSTNWTITGNSFYETTPFVPSNDASQSVIEITTTGVGFKVNNNYIGGNSPECGGTWTKTGAFNTSFTGIRLSVYSAQASNIQGNNIRGFSFTNPATSNFIGISVTGNVNVGETLGNTIGSPDGNGSITLKNGTSDGVLTGIYINENSDITASNNRIASVTVANTDATTATNFYGIHNSGTGTVVLNNNTIGSTSVANSILASSTSTGATQNIYGIMVDGAGTNTLSNNTIANLTNASSNPAVIGVNGTVSGIFMSNGANTVTGNTVRNLTIANASVVASANGTVTGIAFGNTSPAQTITGNTIYNLSNSNPSYTGCVIGLYYMGSTTASVVSRNFIHSLSASSASTSVNIYGIYLNRGTVTCSNNIISLGSGISNGNGFCGIKNTSTLGITNLYFNTVDIEGVTTGETGNTYALSNAGLVRDYRNNIFNNARSGGSTGKHYAISLSSTTNLTCDYNDLYAPNGMLGYFGGNITSLGNWQTATGKDAHSVATNPHFANPGGTSTASYLPSEISLIAVAGTGITSDYAGTTRVYPAMGAYEYPVGPPVIEITATSGDAGPAGYLSLKAAFDRINDGTHQGAITIKILANTTETASAVLNASGNGSASYTAVNLYPASTGLTISGNLAAPLIDLNGADNVTINGSMNGLNAGKDLTITNTSTASTAGTSTIRFYNDATSNVVKYCTVKGSSLDVTGGIIAFADEAGTTGNDGNTIDHNDITGASDAGRPIQAIYASGTESKNSNNNLVCNNNIYNVTNRAIDSHAIYISGSTEWTIIGNSFYETNVLIPTGPTSHFCINITASYDGSAYIVSNNFIGGSSAGCGGMWTEASLYDDRLLAVGVETGNSIASNIQGNTIRNFSISSTDATPWIGMALNGGIANIGTTAGNTIGDPVSEGSITITAGAAGNSLVYGLALAASGTFNIQNNVICSITAANADTSAATDFIGIYNGSPGEAVIHGNTIGSATIANSIRSASAASGGPQTMIGIMSDASGVTQISGNTIANLTNGNTCADPTMNGWTCGIMTLDGTNTVTGNTVRNLKIANANNNGDQVASVTGINQLSSAAGQVVSDNTIYFLSNTFAPFNGSVTGIYYKGGLTGTNRVSGNFIHGLSVSPSSADGHLYGIKIESGVTTYANNIISLDDNTSSNITGIYEFGEADNNNSLYFNTVYIGGTTGPGAPNTSYALNSAGIYNQADIRNNVFFNGRSTGGGSLQHYAVNFVSDTRTITCDYNDYYHTGTGGVLGSYSTSVFALPIVTGQDAHSLMKNPLFASAGSTSASGYKPMTSLAGIAGTGITTDYAEKARIVPPTMGAFENDCANPTFGGTVSVDQAGCSPFTPGPVTCTAPSGQTGTLEYQWQSSLNDSTFTDIGGATSSSYSPGGLTITTWFKRLARVSCMTGWTGAAGSDAAKITVFNLPTATASVTANVICYGESNGSVNVSVSGGSSPYAYAWSTSPVQTSSQASGLAGGNYRVTVTDLNGCITTASVALTGPSAALAASAAETKTVSCFGGSNGEATVYPSHGWGSYTYHWSNSQTSATATGFATGSYTVTVTDGNGCTTTASAFVSQPSAALSATDAQTDVLGCHGDKSGSINLTLSGGTSPYYFAWTGTGVTATAEDQSGLGAGTYNVTITDARSCKTATSATLTQPDTLQANVS
ncbi:MAG: LamG-like jellyroll fold domain-containing protein, partial [Bacteroidota bacterium]